MTFGGCVNLQMHWLFAPLMAKRLPRGRLVKGKHVMQRPASHRDQTLGTYCGSDVPTDSRPQSAPPATAFHPDDQRLMKRALTLAERGLGWTAPNPMVGCVIAKNGNIIGEGHHQGHRWDAESGKHHAEVNALNAAGHAASGATAYVTLEPCNHYGTTPPCTLALIEAGISRVVYAMADPNPVAAGGAATLREAGIDTQLGPYTEEATALNRIWLHNLHHQRPFVVAKFAASLDGRIATSTGDSQWITGQKARNRAHDLRQACDAIMVGAGTIHADNPQLTVRRADDGRACHPMRIVVDPALRASPLARVFHEETPGGAMVITGSDVTDERRAAFEDRDIPVHTVPLNSKGQFDLPVLLGHLHHQNITSVMVEGGSTMLGHVLDAELVDEVWAFIAPVLIGGTGLPAIGGRGFETLSDCLRLENPEIEVLDQDILIRGQRAKASPATLNKGAL